MTQMKPHTIRVFLGCLLASSFLFGSSDLWAMESTAVLPAGASRVSLLGVTTNIEAARGPDGKSQSLAHPLMQDLPFDQLVSNAQGFDRIQLAALLQNAGLTGDLSAGRFTADLKAQVQVVAPTFAYGVTDRLTFALGVPYYTARSSARLGFEPNENAEAAVQALVDEGQTLRAREAATQLNAAAMALQSRLVANGYEEIDDWAASGLGDLEVQARYLHLAQGPLRVASLSGVVLPTGRTSDPDILTDVPFGGGTYNIFAGVLFDQRLTSELMFNQYFRYTHHLRGQKDVRMVTESESISVAKQRVSYQIGDKFATGVSGQLSLLNGLVGGLGYNFERKFGDRYAAGESSSILATHSDQEAHIAEGTIGYSTLRQFLVQQASVPFSTGLSYQRQLAARNLPIRDLISVDVKVFF